MNTGFTVMRLQPFHKGHQKIIDKMLKENSKAVLFIGSADTYNEKNPFSFKERLKMVKCIYKDEIKNKKLIVCAINDIHNPPLWANHVKSKLPIQANCYYCGTGQDAALFKREGFKTVKINRCKLKISGTEIRKKLKTGDSSWQNDVPSLIHHIIQKSEGGLK